MREISKNVVSNWPPLAMDRVNTRLSQWCKQIKFKENTCLFLLALSYWEKTNKSPNLEPYVVLVSYTLWCFSFFISEAVLLSLEDFPFVLCFGGGVSLYWGRNSHIVEAALLGYLLLYPTCLLGYLLLVLLVYLSTCYLFFLDLHVTLP